MMGELKRFFTVGLCATSSCSSLVGWGQDLRLNRALERKAVAQMTTDQKQMRQALFNTFDYTDIIQALYQLHDAYNNPAITPESFKHVAKNLPFQNALPDTPTQGQLTDLSLKNDVLEAISQHKLTSEELLNYIDPLTPAQSNQIYDRLEKAQHKINLENQWVETMSEIKEQLNEDMVNRYPLGIEDYPEVKEKIDALFDTYLEEVYGLLITAQQNEVSQTLSEDENYQAFSYGVTRSLAKRNTAFAAIKRDLCAQGIKLFNQRPARVQVEQTPADNEYDY